MAAPVTDPGTRQVDPDALPWAEWGPGINVKLLRVSDETGSYVLMAKFGADVTLPRHRHFGTVDAYTISGRWRYLEYDWVATTGSYVHEPPGATHTLHTDEETVVVFTVNGGLLLLGPNDELLFYEDFATARERYAWALQAQGIEYPEGVLS